MIIDKVLNFIDNTKTNKSAFEKKAGLSNGYLANIKKSGSEIQPRMVKKILKAFPELESELESKASLQPEIGIPLIPIDAMAGYGEGETQIMDYDAEYYVIPEFKRLKVDFLIRVKGDSMLPHYNGGDIVACRKLSLKDVFFQWNRVYVLDTDQGPLIKRIHKGADEHHILIVSDNPAYHPFSLDLSHVYALALVMGCIRFE